MSAAVTSESGMRANESGPRLAERRRARAARVRRVPYEPRRPRALDVDPYAQLLALDARSRLLQIALPVLLFALATELLLLLPSLLGLLARLARLLDAMPPALMTGLFKLLLAAATGVLSLFGVASVIANRERREWLRTVATAGAIAVGGAALLALSVGAYRVYAGAPLPLQHELGVVARAAFGGLVLGAILFTTAWVFGAAPWVRWLVGVASAVVSAFVLIVIMHLPTKTAPRISNEPIDISLDEPPPPPPAPTTPEPEPETAKAAPPPAALPPPPPAAAAQASKTLNAEPDPNKPEDFSSFTIPQGNADSFAGGTTMAGGTSTGPVYNPYAQATGVPGGTGTVAAPPPPPQAAAPPPVDHSRRAGLTSTNWNCGFPPEADVAQIDDAIVQIQITVNPDGTPGGVRVLSSPGNGFDRYAVQCAMRRRFTPALDREGNPVRGTIVTPVHFSR